MAMSATSAGVSARSSCDRSVATSRAIPPPQAFAKLVDPRAGVEIFAARLLAGRGGPRDGATLEFAQTPCACMRGAGPLQVPTSKGCFGPAPTSMSMARMYTWASWAASSSYAGTARGRGPPRPSSSAPTRICPLRPCSPNLPLGVRVACTLACCVALSSEELARPVGGRGASLATTAARLPTIGLA